MYQKPPNYYSKKTLEIADLGENMHLEKPATKTKAPVIISNDMTSILPDGSTMESSQIAIFQLPGLSKQARQINIYPKIKTSPLISLGVLCDDRCTITLENKYTTVQKNGQQKIKRTRNKKNWNVGSSPVNTKN